VEGAGTPKLSRVLFLSLAMLFFVVQGFVVLVV
jgi:hypothetical protein